MLHLGPLALETPVLCAPIAGFTDDLFRRTVRQLGGCGLLFTEMIWAGGWIEGKIDPKRLRGVESEPRPLGVQLWDREPHLIEEAARRVVDLGVSLVDLNFGCPKRRIMGRHAAGATLLRDPATVGRLVAAAVRGAGPVPVTAKMRLGPCNTAATAPEVARAAAENGAVAVTVHGRTAEQNYGEPSRGERIAEVVAAVRIPVIANGDVRDAPSALELLRRSGAAGIMVARAALNRPWIFREIAAALRGEPVPPPPSPAEQKAMMLAHHRAMVEREGEERGTVLMRKYAARYLTATPGVAALRDAVNRATRAAEFVEAVERCFGPTQPPPRPAAGELTASAAGT
jgi:tRNA-dihydrouridine synthase B